MDSDPIERRDDLSKMLFDGVGSINFRIGIFIFLLFIFVTSNLFVQYGLTRFTGAVIDGGLTMWGTVLQGLFMSLAYIVIDAMVQMGVL